MLTEKAYEAIKAAILGLELEPGSRLIERRLAEQFGVSKSPVRDALNRLAGEGLVLQTAYSGMLVREFDPPFVDELYLVREQLEVMAVELSTPRLRPEDVAEGIASLRTAELAIEARDRSALGVASSRFHAVFHRRSENRPLQQILNGIQNQVRMITALNWRSREETMWEAHQQHCKILDAARSGQVKTAVDLMRDHIQQGRLEYRRGFHLGGEQARDLSAT